MSAKGFMRKCIAGVKRSGNVAASSAKAMCKGLAKSKKRKRRKGR